MNDRSQSASGLRARHGVIVVIAAALAVALVMAGGARADQPDALVLVALPDSVRILSGMRVPTHARLENRGRDTCHVGPASRDEAVSTGTEVEIEILDIRFAPDSTYDPGRLHSVSDDEVRVVLGWRPSDLAPGDTLDVTTSLVRKLARPGVYRMRCVVRRLPVREGKRSGSGSRSLRSNAFVVRVDPITAGDMVRLAADPDSTVRANASSLVAGWGTSAEQRDFLERMLADPVGSVRMRAVGAIVDSRYWRLEPADSARVAARVGALQNDPDPGVRAGLDRYRWIRGPRRPLGAGARAP